MGIKVAKKNMEVSQMTYEFSLMTTIYSIENAYYSLIGEPGKILSPQSKTWHRHRVSGRNPQESELGSLIDLDTKDAESRVSSAKSSLIAIRQAYMTSANTLRSLLSDDLLSGRTRISTSPMSSSPTRLCPAAPRVGSRNDDAPGPAPDEKRPGKQGHLRQIQLQSNFSRSWTCRLLCSLRCKPHNGPVL
jgi:hypothetical protein